MTASNFDTLWATLLLKPDAEIRAVVLCRLQNEGRRARNAEYALRLQVRALKSAVRRLAAKKYGA